MRVDTIFSTHPYCYRHTPYITSHLVRYSCLIFSPVSGCFCFWSVKINIERTRIQGNLLYIPTRTSTATLLLLSRCIFTIFRSINKHLYLVCNFLRPYSFFYRMIDSYKQIQTTNSFINIVERYNQIEQRQGR